MRQNDEGVSVRNIRVTASKIHETECLYDEERTVKYTELLKSEERNVDERITA